MPLVPPTTPSRRRTLTAARKRARTQASAPGPVIKQERQPTTSPTPLKGPHKGSGAVLKPGGPGKLTPGGPPASGTRQVLRSERVATSSNQAARNQRVSERAGSKFKISFENGRAVHTYGNDVPADQRRQVLSLAASRRARKRLSA